MPSDPIQMLVVSNGCPLPDGIETLISNEHSDATVVDRVSDIGEGDLSPQLGAAFVLGTSHDPDARADAVAEAGRLAERCTADHVGVILMTPDADRRKQQAAATHLEFVPSDASGDELLGRLRTMVDYKPVISRLEHELNNMQRLGKRLNVHFTEIDQEMRLASRLQRDFLPKEMPDPDGIRIAAIYRPATWVSGDIYDVFRVDEDHVGLYVADAVGHGMAAGLLTMFIKLTIVPKRTFKQGYEIIPPGDVLARLNRTLNEQNLPNCQFVTACYCLYDTARRELRVARGGHPYPIRIGTDGNLAEIRSAGGLLGVFPGEEFETVSTRLEPGEKLIIYSDGIEMALMEEQGAEGAVPRFKNEFQALAHLPADELTANLTAMLDAEEGSLNPHDDVTLIVLEVPE